jgi:hypothetical protein
MIEKAAASPPSSARFVSPPLFGIRLGASSGSFTLNFWLFREIADRHAY